MVDKYIETSRLKAAFAGLILLSFLGYVIFVATRDLYLVLAGLSENAKLIELNVYGLIIPLLCTGAFIYMSCGFVVGLKHGKKANMVWSAKTEKLLHRQMAVFAVIGLVFAIGMYKWLDSEFKARGYIYCEGESSLSAMGKHEVYMKPVCDNAYYEANR
ncbi:Putative uncharacterized protein [Moritella viscosa]|uniref:hypothetical protein n=1 Tax=Moritella viscosa TaxID=80854 RepID=UPI000911EBDA|nr:hypothetical protein [Moritella viscosa]SGZ10946.1 Putative uncharacterized protein [Moritella viscosa]